MKAAFPTAEHELGLKVQSLSSVVSKLLDLLVDLHSLPEGDAYNDDRVKCTLSLMEFLRGLHREDTFIKYVHQLIRLQEHSGHYAEAGLALELHARMYDWRLDSRVPALQDIDLPTQSEFRRREALSLQMVRYFTLGGAPELAIATYKELANAYETISFELEKLQSTTSTIARLYKEEQSVNATTRPQPQYFRVVYSGLGFHRALRGKQFIMQGSKWEKLSDFTVRLQNLYPQAKIITASGGTSATSTAAKHMSIASSLSSLSQTSSLDASLAAGDGGDAEGQYLSIIAVSPEPSVELGSAVEILPAARDFFLRQNLQRFSVSRPIKIGRPASTNGNGVSSTNSVDVWIEKTIFETREKFPTILRRSEVVNAEVTRISPLAGAADAIARKAGEIEQMARRSKAAPGDEMCSSQLGMLLSGAVDAPVNGGIQVYRILLESYASDQTAGIVMEKERMRSVMQDYVAVLAYALHVHSAVVASALRPLHDSLVILFDRNFKDEIKIVEEEGRVIDGLDLRNGIRRSPDDIRNGLHHLAQQSTNASASSGRNNELRAVQTNGSGGQNGVSASANKSEASLTLTPTTSASSRAGSASGSPGHKRKASMRNVIDRKQSSVTLKSEYSFESAPSSSSSSKSKGSSSGSTSSLARGMAGVTRRFSKMMTTNGNGLSNGGSRIARQSLTSFREEE